VCRERWGTPKHRKKKVRKGRGQIEEGLLGNGGMGEKKTGGTHCAGNPGGARNCVNFRKEKGGGVRREP